MNAKLQSTCRRACAAVSILVFVSACGSAARSQSTSALAVRAAAVAIPAADRFAPFIIQIQSGSQVTFHNGDADAHTVVSVPGDGLHLNITLGPGQSTAVTVSLLGIHRYFCSIHAHWDPKTGEVAANANADRPSEPMEGVVVAT